MIRKAVIVVLTLGAAAVSVGWGLSDHLLIGRDWEFWEFDSFTLDLRGTSWTFHTGTRPKGFLRVIGASGDLSLDYHYDVAPNTSEEQPERRFRVGGLDAWARAYRDDYGGAFNAYTLRLPFWVLFVLFAAYPSVALIRGPLHRWRRRRKGLCVNCGHDLTGNLTSVCSECGRACPMNGRHRLRRFSKWAGAALSLVLVLLLGVSLWWGASVYIPGYFVVYGRGSVIVFWGRDIREQQGGFDERDFREPQWDFRAKRRSGPLVVEWKPRWRGPPVFTLSGVEVPLWIPFLAIALPTAILWYRDRRYPSGHCQECAYDLTGNVSGICPECGTRIVRSEGDEVA